MRGVVSVPPSRLSCHASALPLMPPVAVTTALPEIVSRPQSGLDAMPPPPVGHDDERRVARLL